MSYELRDWPLDLRRFVLDAYTTYLHVYRTPEPQLSFAVFLVHLAAVVRIVAAVAPGRGHWLFLGVTSTALWSSYPFFALGGTMMTMAAALALATGGQWRRAASVAIVGVALVSLLAGRLAVSHAGEADATLYASSLPLFAPSMMYGAIFALGTVIVARRRVPSDPLLMLGLLALLAPVATLNQQVLTGVMVQALNWERYINFPLVVLGAAIVWERFSLGSRILAGGREAAEKIAPFVHRVLDRSPRLRTALDVIRTSPVSGARRYWQAAAVSTVLVIAALFIYSAQLTNYRQFVGFNLQTLAYANLADRVRDMLDGDPDTDLLLGAMASDAAVRARSADPQAAFYGYTDILGLVHTGLENAADEAPAVWGYMYAWRLGLDDEAYQAALLAEIEAGICWPHLMYHFDFKDCAPYVSDFRLYDPDLLKRQVPAVVEHYREFVEQSSARPAPGIILLPGNVDATVQNRFWQEEVIAKQRVRLSPDSFAGAIEAQARAVRQTLRNPVTSRELRR